MALTTWIPLYSLVSRLIVEGDISIGGIDTQETTIKKVYSSFAIFNTLQFAWVLVWVGPSFNGPNQKGT